MTAQPDPAQGAPPQRNVFESAKAIADTLAGIPKNDQERVLRWVAESLGIQLGAAPASGHAIPPHVPPVSPAGFTPPAPPPARAQDIRTFVQSKQPKSDNQFAAVVAYYYRFEAPPEQRRDSVTPEFLQEATRQAGRERLGNPRATLNNAVAMGYLDRAARGEFSISTVGENLVAMTLPGGGDNGGSVPRNRGGRKTASKKTAKKARRSGRE